MSAEKSASSPSATAGPTRAPKPRSCVVCRFRKVRCDKLSPCSNCRRANIACVLPSTDRPPRWARRLGLERAGTESASSSASTAPVDIMDRLRHLEGLVQDLTGQLDQANAAAVRTSSVAGGSSGVGSPESSSQDHITEPGVNNIQKPFGRLVLQDANRGRYVSSGFWSRVGDEVRRPAIFPATNFAMDCYTSEEEASLGKSSSTQELDRTPSERHAFLFRHNLGPSTPYLRAFHPLPSQIPFLLDVFSENINTILQIVHLPTVTKLVRDLRSSNMGSLTPANEALMFSIYYAAITSMDEDDIMTNFGQAKTDLNLKYRLGLEHALAKADFLNVPDLVLVQAFAIFLSLLRRHDSPRFVWMMTGLVVRMGQALGLHRDGANLKNLTPYETEMRRKTWWVLCMLDMRSSEDQGTDYIIPRGSFDTKPPLNINEADIDPKTTVMPTAREGITDTTYLLVQIEIGKVSKEMMDLGTKEGAIEEQNRLLNEMYQKVDQGYLQYATDLSVGSIYWVQVSVIHLVMAKMTLFVYLPILFSSTSEHYSDHIRTKLLIAAIELAEYNHALNAERACRQWRWVYQVYTHWNAIVYLLMECSRRLWSPIIERSWVALQSPWLIPAQSNMDKNQRVWIPLRKLTAKAKKHRDAEIERLRNDPQAAAQLETEDQGNPVPGSPGPFPAGSNVVELFRERWRQLLARPQQSVSRPVNPSPHPTQAQPTSNPITSYNPSGMGSVPTFDPTYLNVSDLQPQNLPSSRSSDSGVTTNVPGDFTVSQAANPSYNAAPPVPETTTWPGDPGVVPWLWGGLWSDANQSTDAFANVDLDAIDVNMDIDGEMDWYSWMESAKGMEFDASAGPSGSG
ncbi:Bikaverin cluster transcription factor bik5 [Lachnellula suecica]|uniref:Bikaverin cluster transcription factor bik5 n=1 Tax=Lachnellula suecica TaxID=602035 RepID=A0A8T9C363_9HELO|nr:Bikaverin cluster transcription factor bik5 [Lachnellula suecica]